MNDALSRDGFQFGILRQIHNQKEASRVPIQSDIREIGDIIRIP